MQDKRSKKVGFNTVYMCVGVVVLHGSVETFLKKASAWSARNREYECEVIFKTCYLYKLFL